MRPLRYILMGLAVAAAILVAFLIGQNHPKSGHFQPLAVKVDTLLIRDTIKVTEPRYVTRRVVDSVAIPVTDTLRLRDTLYVFLEREQVRWEDSLSVVYASGIRPQVDSVIHYTMDKVITKEIPVVMYKKTRWGIGVQAGFGAYKGGLTPYVGVGISYNLFAF